jgi:RNA ligase
VHATAILRSRYAGFTPPAGYTVLVEIIYPGNRIVIDYGTLDDLVLLGAVDNATGRTYGPDAIPTWPGPVVERFDHATLADALAAPARTNREGFVVWFPRTDIRVKIKYEEYVRLHRIVTGLNARAVWELLVAGSELGTYVETLPDEFHPRVRDVVAALTARVEARAAAIEAAYAAIVAALEPDWQRKDFARAVASHPERSSLFVRLDNRDYRPYLWQQARPEADWTPSGFAPATDAD